MNEIESKFKKRGYPTKNTTTQKERTREIERATLLLDKPKANAKRTPFSTTYNHRHPPIRNTLDKNRHILQTNKDLAEIFQEKPVLAYRRNKNLRDLIGQTYL